jgi:hypothetical protein
VPSTYVRSLYGASVNAYLAHFAAMLILANEHLECDLFDVICDGGPYLVSGEVPVVDVRVIAEGKTVDVPPPAEVAGVPTTRFDPWSLVVRSQLLGVGSFAVVIHPDERIETSLVLPAGPHREEELVLEAAVRPSLDDIEVIHELFSQVMKCGIAVYRGTQPPSLVADLLAAIFTPRPESEAPPASTGEETLDGSRRST